MEILATVSTSVVAYTMTSYEGYRKGTIGTNTDELKGKASILKYKSMSHDSHHLTWCLGKTA